MKCQLCNIEAVISASRYVIENDDTPDEKTELFIEQDIMCRNPQCNNNGQVIKTIKNPINLG